MTGFATTIASDRTTLKYASTRRELWDWYWRAWREPRGLWRVHLGLCALCILEVVVLRDRAAPVTFGSVAEALLVALLLIACLVSYPQIMFRSSERTLHFDELGIDTTRGSVSAKRAWREIASVDEHGSSLVVRGRSGNAFIVPRRAFADDAERAELLAKIARWRSAQAAEKL